MSASPGQAREQEFRVRIGARNRKKTYQVLKFNASLRMDPAKWTACRMARENNKKDHRGGEEELPKYGAGSEFGREQREEARRRKFGMKSRKYNPDAQPWLMRVGSKRDGKQYKGTREGGVADNTAYYVFTHASDGSFEAHPVKEWYNFVPRVTYKTLDADEAEEKFAERGKILNHWAMMVNKKLKPEQEDNEDDDLDESDGKKKRGKGGKGKNDLKLSDMDDWVGDSDDELDSDSDDGEKKRKKDSDDEDDDGGKKGKKGKGRSKDSKKKKKRKNKDEVDSEGFEDSDDGDDEGREVDYMSDESSDSEEELQLKADIKGVDMDEGLSKMLDSDESEDEENKEGEKEDEEDESKPKKDGDDDADSSADAGKKGKKKGKGSKNSSRATTPTPEEGDDKTARAEKRKAIVDNLLDPNAGPEPSAKKSRMDLFGQGTSSSASGSSGGGSGGNPPPAAAGSVEAAFEEDVKRYLARKPMTTTEILKKMTKKSGKSKDEVMPMLVNALKRINPHKQKSKGTMYLSLR